MGKTTLVMPVHQQSVIKITGFHKRYRKQTVVKGIELNVGKGEIYGLIGPDGAGKSSLMKAVAGVMTFDSGDIEVFGIRLDTESAAETIKSRIGFMPQGLGLSLYPELSVEENIDFFARLRLVPEKELAERKKRLLAMTRLENFRKRYMKNLSGGMKQKLGLICTLIHEPELLILDEPTTGVDPVSRRDFWTILAELLNERGITALLTTAYMDEASRFNRVSLMYDGRILDEGEPEVIEERIAGSTVMLKTPQQGEALAQLSTQFSQLQPQGPWLRIFVDIADHTVAEQSVINALNGVSIEAIHTDKPELEDAFVALLRHQKLVAGKIEKVTFPAHTEKSTNILDNNIAIEARELTKDFGSFRAVDRVNFCVNQGEIFGLLGANGAGKTTVIKMLTGILRPTTGQGSVAGNDLRKVGRTIKRRIGYMSQEFSLYTDLTVMENIRLYAGIYGLNAKQTRERCKWIIDMASLSEHVSVRAKSLPVGMRQRLALGCALVHSPDVLFLDEPTSGIDPIGRQRFWDILFQLSRQDNVAVLVTTHYMSEAEHCDHLALMYAGKVVADASPEEMKQDIEAEAGRLLEIKTDQPVRAIECLANAGFGEPALFGRHIHVLSRQTEFDTQRIPHVLENLKVFSITTQDLTMEDVFVYQIRKLERQGQGNSVGCAS